MSFLISCFSQVSVTWGGGQSRQSPQGEDRARWGAFVELTGQKSLLQGVSGEEFRPRTAAVQWSWLGWREPRRGGHEVQVAQEQRTQDVRCSSWTMVGWSWEDLDPD